MRKLKKWKKRKNKKRKQNKEADFNIERALVGNRVERIRNNEQSAFINNKKNIRMT